jgi:hypothetical protein
MRVVVSLRPVRSQLLGFRPFGFIGGREVRAVTDLLLAPRGFHKSWLRRVEAGSGIRVTLTVVVFRSIGLV